MAYRLSFFCRADEEHADSAVSLLLDELLATGGPLFGESCPGLADGVSAFRLATAGPDGRPVGDLLTLEVHVGVARIAEFVIEASPDDGHGVWGCDLLATVTLVGDAPDWPLVGRIGTALERLWGAVPWDEASGFEVAAGLP
ncbi:hypothetical protein ACWCYY_04605 [Kitasatospora sp. NPDC001664]